MLVSKNWRTVGNVKNLWLVFVGVCVLERNGISGLLIAKSDLTVCENVGPNPHNVVDNKSCEKKLIITQAIASGQKGTEALLFTTNKIYDRLEKEEARLYNPFILRISKTTLRLVYPFFYEGTVNNKPYEELRSQVKCRDGFYEEEESSCGFARDPQGHKIWDSQGFCCSCSLYEVVPSWLRKLAFGGHVYEYHRGGQGGLCGYSHVHDENDKFSFCMRLDKLWYDVFSIKEPRLSFVITIQAYDEATKVVDNKTVTEWVEGGKIQLNYQKRSAVGQYGRLIATFHGTYASTNEVPNLVHNYLLIPKPGASGRNSDHPQLRNGYRDYMLVPRDMVSLLDSINSCNMIGVSYSSFRRQGGGSRGRGYGCQQKVNSCFNNQPKDLFEQDTLLRDSGHRPAYFVETYGNCIGVNRDGNSENLGIVYQLDDTVRNSLITLEVSADDMILIYNRATGVIVRSYAKDFDALSQDGFLTVTVQNTGLVTADFFVVFAGCSKGVYRNDEKRASINPKALHSFHYEITVFKRKGALHYCAVELYDSRRRLQDSTNVTFRTFTPCVCLPHCVCKCNTIGSESEPSRESSDENDCRQPDDEEEDFFEEEEEDDEEFFGGLFSKIVSQFTEILGLEAAVGVALLFLGVCKAMIGRQSLTIAKMGLGGVQTGKKVTKKIMGQERSLVYNAEMHLVDPQTNEVIIPNNPSWDFYVNIFFFILLPVLLLIKIGKLIGRLTKFAPTSARRLSLDDLEAQISSDEQTKETKQAKRIRIVPKKGQKLKGALKLAAKVPKMKGSPKKGGNNPKSKGPAKKGAK